MTVHGEPMPGPFDEVKIPGDALDALTEARSRAFDEDMRQREERARRNAALIEAAAAVQSGTIDREALAAWEEQVRTRLAQTPTYVRPPEATADAAIADLQLFRRPWPWPRSRASDGSQQATVDLGSGEAHVGLGLYNRTGAAGGTAEMGGPFRLPSFSDFEFRTTVDYRYDWFFSTAIGSADSQGWISVIVDELLDAPGSQWHPVVNRRVQLWSDSTGSAGSDGATERGNRLTVNERFRGRPDANYVWWVGANETIQTQFQATSQANLYVELLYLVALARV
ncbi:hypothetical protein GCM10010329_44830 [Streptomyces spiroverticillatus]|uniref:Uncharacterized protein n=1 Tax=Streptomyces finlayi TaxID=67296 RepID=A0A918WZL4_9ACTN|nr:hypothetical protein [Streptomyces finlayi]GHA16842.1 hypothetical protein GCM10010329_44830 [Streptomyces spiroverticillatus]GHC98988.1 hypothetical protein GCM10010334_42010 [Streptomyces finlayi]